MNNKFDAWVITTTLHVSRDESCVNANACVSSVSLTQRDGKEREGEGRKRGVSRSFGMGWDVTMFSCMIGLLRFCDGLCFNACGECSMQMTTSRARSACAGPRGRGRITGYACVWAAGAGALRPGLQLFSAACWSDMWRCYKHARGCAEPKHAILYMARENKTTVYHVLRMQRALLCLQTSRAQPLTIISAGSNKVTVTVVQSVSLHTQAGPLSTL